MQIKNKIINVLILIFFSGATIAFPVIGMYISWKWLAFFGGYMRRIIVLVIGICAFTVGVLLFWFITELLRFEEVEM